MSTVEVGNFGEEAAMLIMSKIGIRARRTFGGPFDIVAEGRKIEVKTATLRKGQYKVQGKIQEWTHGCDFWTFNIQRRGVLNESKVDVYLLVLLGNDAVQCCYFIVVPAPLTVPILRITVPSLFREWRPFLNRWELLRITRKRVRQALKYFARIKGIR